MINRHANISVAALERFSIVSKLSLPQYLRMPLLILLLCLAATAMAVSTVRRAVHAQAEALFLADATRIRDAVLDSMRGYGQILRAAAGLVSAVGTPKHSQWKAFAQAQSFEAHFPGIQGLGYVVTLKPAELAAFEAEQRQLGRVGFAVMPKGDRERYSAIVLLEPEDWRNMRAIGYDMMSERVRQTAMMRAEQTGEPSLSGRVVLRQETQENVQAGTLLYFPIYDDPTRPSGRVAKGFVYAAFRMDDLISKALQKQVPDVRSRITFEIHDQSGGDDDTLLYPSTPISGLPPVDGEPARSAYQSTVSSSVMGADWTFHFTAARGFEDRVSLAPVWGIAALGVSLSFLISAIGAAISHSQWRISRIAKELADEVSSRKVAEDAVRIANGELIHRVKNAFSVVSAIASQTARHSTSVSDFMANFRERLDALSRIQDLLRPDQRRSTELDVLIAVVLKPHASNSEQRYTAHGPAVPVAQNEALMLSLLINELATNASKYGSWSVPHGKVDVIWDFVAGGEGRLLRIEWRERGGPKVEPPSRSGFGSSVMSYVVERSLGGTLNSTYHRDGVHHELSMPWSAD